MFYQKELFKFSILNFEKTTILGVFFAISIPYVSLCHGAIYDVVNTSDSVNENLILEPTNFEGAILDKNGIGALKSILELLTAGEYEKALKTAQVYQKKFPTNPLPFNLIAASYMGMGNKEKAIINFNKVLKISPADPMASEALAVIEINKGNYIEARFFLERSLKDNPGHLGLIFGLARLSSRQGEHNKAIEILVHAETLYPQKLEINLFKISELIRLGQLNFAHDELSRLQKKNPDNPILIGMLGDTQIKLNKSQEAIVSFKKLIKLQPNLASAYYMLALAYAKNDDREKYNEFINIANIRDPNHIPTKILLIRQAAIDNNYALANDYLKELKLSHPNSAVVYAQEGWLAEKSNQPTQAIEAYKKAVSLDPESSQLISRLALSQLSAQNVEESTNTLKSWLKTHPKATGIRLLLAEIYHKIGDKQNAVTYYESVLNDDPKNARVLNNLAWLLMSSAPQKAEEYSKKAMDLVPENPQAMDTMGMVLLNSGKIDQSINYLTNASKKAPEDLQIRYHLILANIRAGNTNKGKSMLKDLLANKKEFNERKEAEALLEKLSAN